MKITKLNQEAKMPFYSHPGDAGMDLFSLDNVFIKPNTIVTIPTGIAVEIPEKCVGIIWDKSGLSQIGLHILAGVVDSSYRGEIKVVATNLCSINIELPAGKKIAQMLILPIVTTIIEEGELNKTERGEGGFGSTGL